MLTRPGRLLTAVLASLAVAVPLLSTAPSSAAAAAAPAPLASGTTQQPNVTGAGSTESSPTLALESNDVVDDLPGDRPNLLVLMTDDMRADDLRFMPHVRRLIGGEGVQFVNGFSPNPNCCPARASFLTGRYTHNHGVWTNKAPYGFAAFDDSSTLATDLASAGYRTAFLGKYLNGYGLYPPPNSHRTVTATELEDLSEGFSNRYVPPGWHDWRGAITGLLDDSALAGGVYSYFRTTLNDNGTLRGNPGVYQTRLFGDQSADMLTRLARSPKPFFLWTSFVAPHTGYPVERDDPGPVTRANGKQAGVPTPARPRSVAGMFDDEVTEPAGGVREDDMSDKPRFLRGRPALNAEETAALTEATRQRAESLHVVDQEVARLLGELESTGELDDTIVVFTSDNGQLIGEHGVMQAKKLPYEASIRVPVLLRGPGIPAGEVRRDPFMFPDFAPTLLDAAGVRSRRLMDGVSMLDVARQGDRGWGRPVLTESGPRRVDPAQPAQRAPYPSGPSPLRAVLGVRTERYLYVEHHTGERELYDLRRDPRQLESLAGEPSVRATERRLARLLDRLQRCQGQACASPAARTSGHRGTDTPGAARR